MASPHAGARGQWLREQRQARGWNIQQMVRKLRETGALAGDTLPRNDCLVTTIRRWEKGNGISERYQFHYCHVFQIPPRHFGGMPAPDNAARDHQPARVVLIIVVSASGQAATPAVGST